MKWKKLMKNNRKRTEKIGRKKVWKINEKNNELKIIGKKHEFLKLWKKYGKI